MNVETVSLVAPSEAQSPGLGALLDGFIRQSPYRAFLAPIAEDVERVALQNRQVRAALETLAARIAPPRRTWFRKRDAETAVVLAFLEHVAFASPAFLASVGEWPLGQIRGRS